MAKGHLRVVALDARTGATVWSHPASSSFVTRGVPAHLALSAGKVVFIGPAGATSAKVVAVDGRTGRPVWKSTANYFKSWPGHCPGPRATICVTAVPSSGGGVLRLDAATGKLLATAGVDSGFTPRGVGPGLYDTGDRDPEKLEALEGPRVAWVRPLARIFPLEGASTDEGWNFERIDYAAEFVGSVGSPSLVQSKTTDVSDMARTMTAGFRTANGSVLWRSRGTFEVCGLYPCPGEPQAGYSDAGNARLQGARVVVVMERRGRLTASLKHGKLEFAVSRGTRGILEGLDPARGGVRWSVALAPDAQVLGLYAVPPLVGVRTVVLRRNGTLVAVDLLNGSTRKLTSGLAWCRTAIVYSLKDAAGTGKEPYIGQYSLTPCSAAGGRVAAPPRAPAFVGAFGAKSADIVAWSDKTGVFARPISR